MRSKIKRLLTGLANLWKWRKVIYQDRNYDYWFIYEILKTKLKFKADYLLKHGYHESAGRDVKLILTCVDLIHIVQNEVYLDEVLKVAGLNGELIKDAEFKHEQAKEELFRLLKDNIENWWD